MHKHLLIFTAILCISIKSFATNVSGTISSNTTWTKASSPYIVKGDVTVNAGAKLTIDPGVTILFDGNYTVYIDGFLTMAGTVTDSITVSSNKAKPSLMDYAGFYIRNSVSNDTVVFDHCHFKYANSAMYIEFIAARITNSTFDSCFTAIYNGPNPKSYTYINNCHFDSCQSGVKSNGATVINNCVFDRCSNGFSAATWNAANYCANSAFYDNGASILKCTKVTHNLVVNSSDAIGWCDSVDNNHVLNNGTAIYHCSNISRNNIVNSGQGIMFTESNYYIHNNCIINSSYYNVLNVNHDIDMSNNYWGDTDSAKIAATIMDFNVLPSFGKVQFIPLMPAPATGCADSLKVPPRYMTPPSTGISFANNINNVAAYPNPATSIFNIETKQGVQIKEVTVYNLTGTIVLRKNANTNVNKVQLDAAALAPGMYLYKVSLSDNAIVTGKMAKE